jgi:hypothetical protein
LIYTAETYPFERIYESGIAARKRGKRAKSQRVEYVNVVAAFDIETSVVHRMENGEDEPHAFMYVWQVAIDSDVIMGRSWDAFFAFLGHVDEMCSALQESKNLDTKPYLVMFVHNLAYEFQFLAGLYPFQPEEVFLREARKPIYARMLGCIEFRCSYMHSNMSLSKFTEIMKCEHRKLDGDTFDYDVVRYPWSELTDYETQYCINDVLGLVEAIKTEMKRDGDTLHTLPLTSTGYVRRDAKAALWPIRWKIESILPYQREYALLRAAFRGGDTHANRYKVGKILENVESYDETSAYPAQQRTRNFPITPFRWLSGEDLQMSNIIDYIRHGRAVVGRYVFSGLRLRNEREPVPYLSLSKTQSSAFVVDNGRLLSADLCTTTLTEIDLAIVMRQYSADKIACEEAMIARKGPLPKQYLDVIDKYYQDKTMLKNGPDGETEDEADERQYQYMKSKNKLNGIYGMSAQDPIRESIQFIDGDYQAVHKTDEEKRQALEKAYFPYQWGVYTTAWARYALHEAIQIAGDNIIYNDTDSVKTDAPIDLTELNARLVDRAKRCGAFAHDRNGKVYYMGVFDKEDGYDRFITQGAKRYAYERDGKLGVTVSGVSTKKVKSAGLTLGALELKEAGGLSAFKPGRYAQDEAGRYKKDEKGRRLREGGMVWTLAAGSISVYNDSADFWIKVDGHELHITRNVALIPNSYTMSHSEDYERLLTKINLFGSWRAKQNGKVVS